MWKHENGEVILEGESDDEGTWGLQQPTKEAQAAEEFDKTAGNYSDTCLGFAKF
jgi:hypothetical protein